MLWADDVWHPVDPATGKPGTATRRDRIAGSLRPDGQGGLLVKTGARFSFTVISPEKILVQFVRLRTGEQLPTAFYTVLERFTGVNGGGSWSKVVLVRTSPAGVATPRLTDSSSRTKFMN